MIWRQKERKRDILERAVAAVSEQAAKADALINDLHVAGLPEDGPVLQAKLIRLELLKVKGDLERELGRWVLDCGRCNRRVHWVAGIGIRPGHWARGAGAGPRTEAMDRYEIGERLYVSVLGVSRPSRLATSP
jgi:hypothetical protein